MKKRLFMLIAVICVLAVNLVLSSCSVGINVYSVGLKYKLTNEGDCVVTGIGTCNDTKIVIPSKVNGKKVTRISSEAFAHCKQIESVKIPNSVTSIGGEAFRGCTKLKSVRLPDSLACIDYDTFRSCAALEKITIPGSVISINREAFYECTALESVTIMKGVQRIEHEAFYRCGSLKSIEIPDSISCIEFSAFYYCSKLESFTIPDGITEIGYGTFYKCAALTDITIPQTVTKIDSDVFSGCSKLQYNEYENGLYLGNADNPYLVLMNTKSRNITSCRVHSETRFVYDQAFALCHSLNSVTIPKSVRSIGKKAFGSCENLESISYGGTMAQWKALSKQYNWYDDTADFVVHCTDGDVDKNCKEIVEDAEE